MSVPFIHLRSQETVLRVSTNSEGKAENNQLEQDKILRLPKFLSVPALLCGFTVWGNTHGVNGDLASVPRSRQWAFGLSPLQCRPRRCLRC